MYKVGIAGYGFMGRFHHGAYDKTDAGNVTAVFDVNPKAFESDETAGNIGTAQADKHGVKLLDDYDAFLKEVDVVDICTPTPTHLALVEKAFAAGKHVLLEKPMALTLADCRKILAMADAAEGAFMVSHCVRFWPGYDVMTDAVKSGRFGRLRAATFRRAGGCAFWSPWFLDETKSGGAVLDIMIHDFDLCRLIGGMPDAVVATGTQDGLGKGAGVNTINAFMRYDRPDAPALSVIGGWMPSETFPFHMTFTAQFDEAVLCFGGDPEKPLAIYPRQGDPETPELKAGDGYQLEVDYFLKNIGKPMDRCPPAESMDSVAIALAAKASVLSGNPEKPEA